jgi:hypothetical protein
MLDIRLKEESSMQTHAKTHTCIRILKIILGWIDIALSLVKMVISTLVLEYYFPTFYYTLLLLVIDCERIAIDFFRNLSKLVSRHNIISSCVSVFVYDRILIIDRNKY